MKNKLTIKELELLMNMMETKSISLSAERFHIAPTNLSRTLSALENKIGSLLLDRTSRPMVLTEFTHEFAPLITECLESYGKIMQFIDNYKNNAEGEVSVYAPPTLMMLLAGKVLPVIKKQYPGIKLTLLTNSLETDDYIRGTLFPDSCDLLLTHTYPRDKSLIARRVCVLDSNVFATPGFISNHPIKNINDYINQPCIQYNFMGKQHNEWFFINNINGGKESIKISGEMTCDNLLVALNYASNGTGYIFSPNYAVDFFNFKDMLFATLPTQYTAKIPLYVIYKKQYTIPYRVKITIDTIINVVSKIIPPPFY